MIQNNDEDKLKARLRECEDRYRSFTETSIDAVITSDDNDSLLTWNHGAEIIFGYGTEIIGQPVPTIIPERYRKAHRDGVKRFLDSGERRLIGKTVELDALRKDGKEFPIELSLTSWKSSSGMYFGAIIRDISERKRIERLREDVQRMMRHDLRSPLIGITGLARVLAKGSYLTERERKAVALIQEIGKKTLKFIDRNRDLFQIKQGVYKLTPVPVDLIAILHRIKKEIEPLLLKKRIDTEITIFCQPIGKDSKYTLQGDEGLLDIMLVNLIKNAVEASPIKATIKIKIKENKDKDDHLIDIHNMGTVPEDLREKFFDPYTTSGKKGGTGLGTHSALLIARTHQGDIYFTTSEEEGTHVIVQLPKELKTGKP